MSLVRVWTNVGQKKPRALLAKIFSTEEGPVYTMRYLSSVSEDGRTIFRYEEDSYQVDDDSVAEWLGTDDETDLGFIQIDDDSWVKEDNDSDYVPDSSEEEDSTDEEEDEEDEDEEEEENDDYE
jgi:hypothetical protein